MSTLIALFKACLLVLVLFILKFKNSNLGLIVKLNSTRRQFLKSSAVTAAYAGATGVASTSLANTSIVGAEGLSKSDYDDWIVFNGLGHIFDILDWIEPPKVKTNVISPGLREKLIKTGLGCIRVTTGAVYPAYPGDDIFESCVKAVSDSTSWIVANNDILVLARSADEIVKAKSDGKVAITFGFQNSHVLGKNLERVDIFRNFGVLTMQLTYNGQNQIGGGANVSGRIPLSKFGHEVVEKMNESRVLIDLSHSGERTCLDTIKASKMPVTISHSGCRALVDVPRNKTDEEMRKLAEKGGVFGLYFMPFLAKNGLARSEHLIAHIEHALNVCGEDHVAFGTDGHFTSYGSSSNLERIHDFFDKFTQKRIDGGVAAQGEKLGSVLFLPDLVGPDMFYRLADKLSRRGHTASTIEKVMGANALRIMQEVC